MGWRDIQELRCQMLTVYVESDESGYGEVRSTKPCGEPLGTHVISGGTFFLDPTDGEGPYLSEDESSWDVRCRAGHVLLIPYYDGGSVPPFDLAEFLDACKDLIEFRPEGAA